MKLSQFLSSKSSQIIVAMIIGVIVGTYLGPDSKPLAEVGKIIIQLIKVAAIPLLFLTIIRSIVTSDVELKDGRKLIFFTTINSTIALVIGLCFSNFFRPGEHLNISSPVSADTVPAVQKLDWLLTLKSYLPTSIVSPFAENAIIPVVIMAVLIAAAMRAVKSGATATTKPLEDLVDILLQVTEKILFWMISLIPIAILFVVAYSVGQYGFAPFKGLMAYVGVAIAGMLFHILFTHQLWVKFYAKIPLRKFWQAARDPIFYALGTNSSLATLPITLKALKKLNISERASSLGACIGTNLNNDGIILYEAMAVFFVAQAHGIDLSLTQQIYIAGLCLVAAIGVAGIPEAGFVSLTLVLVTAGMPVEFLPLLLTVDWIVARARSVTNSLSDMVISILIDKTNSR
jgi:Na+/H+-dicarboxylate symporter